MKNFFKLQSFVIAILLAIGLSFGACVESDDDNDIDNDIDNDSDNDSDSNAKVTGVSISPSSATIAKGGYWVFTTTVNGTGNPAQTVEWSINETDKAEGTTIDSSGKLIVADNENLTTITIKAVSTADTSKSRTASITIVNNPAYTTQQDFEDITATELVSRIKVGWNLGNTFDATNFPSGLTSSVSYLETAWLGGESRVTTKALFDTLKNKGFNAVRIPVSWNKVIDADYHIRSDWMARVTEVVNYAVANDMYILLNTHHDDNIFKLTDAYIEQSLIIFGKIWEQIAANFKNYDEKLIFEALNEPRTEGSPNEWIGGSAEEHTNLNKYYQLFVNTVRETGGNNDKRILQINTYAASREQAAINGLAIPDDTAADKIIVSIHAYVPQRFAMAGDTTTWTASSSTNQIDTVMNRAKTAFIDNGIPVIFGEFGAANKDNEESRALYAKTYIEKAKAIGAPCFWWDNGGLAVNPNSLAGPGQPENFDLIKRDTLEFPFPAIITAIMEGAGVE
uniref:Glycoside hydrolase family 5 n=1 Tax=uncultured bacterium contig00133 TaxID=1181582 RepID=A0A806KN28_9BACT|nr:glycoside hydrolase family 5 [uncultured bacterium contig00133]